MRFVVLQDTIEYWRTTGRVTVYPNTSHNRSHVLHLADTYGLIEQAFANRLEFTLWFI